MVASHGAKQILRLVRLGRRRPRSRVLRIMRSKDCLLTTLPDGSGVLLHVGAKRYLSLNDTGVCVWMALEHGPQTPDELALVVADRFDVEVKTAALDVATFVAALASEGAIDVCA